MIRRRRPGTRAAVLAAGLALLVVVGTGTDATRAAWTTAGLANPAGSAATGSTAVTHTYGPHTCASTARTAGTQTCAGSPGPTAAATVPGVTSTLQTRNDGSLPGGAVTASVGAPSCGPVSLANAVNPTNPMLPRHGTSFRAAGPFGGTNAISLDGSLAYASAVLLQTEQGSGLLAPGTTAGLGVWFATSDSQGGPLMEIAASPVDTAGSDSRSLHLNPNGTLTFVQSATGGGAATMTTSGHPALNDGGWHFAYVTLSINVAGTTTTTRVFVDGVQRASGGGLFVPYSTDTGYWHLGWAPTARTGLATAHFAGRLSNAVLFTAGTAPAAPNATQRGSQSGFSTWATGARDHWLLGDAGTTTYGGPYPVIGATSPCSLVDLTWATTGPASQVGPMPLSTFADGSWRTVAFPAPSVQQSSTLTLTRGAGYSPYVTGLRLYAPLRHRVEAGGSWTTTFSWPDATGVFLG